MSLGLHSLTAHPSSSKRRKRLGRGNASGHGTYSTRGQKGQRARTGGRKGLRKKAIRSLILHLPKQKGFRSLVPHATTVTLDVLAQKFPDGATITVNLLKRRGLVGGRDRLVRIVGTTLAKKFVIRADGFSGSAIRAILGAGGEAHVR